MRIRELDPPLNNRINSGICTLCWTASLRRCGIVLGSTVFMHANNRKYLNGNNIEYVQSFQHHSDVAIPKWSCTCWRHQLLNLFCLYWVLEILSAAQNPIEGKWDCILVGYMDFYNRLTVPGIFYFIQSLILGFKLSIPWIRTIFNETKSLEIWLNWKLFSNSRGLKGDEMWQNLFILAVLSQFFSFWALLGI